MQSILKISAILFLLFTLFSCSKEFTVDFKNVEKKIVVNAFVNSSDTLRASVTSNFKTTVNTEIEELVNADVSIYAGDVFIETMSYKKLPQERVGHFYASFIPTAGIVYRIEVAETGFASVNATAIVPAATNILASTAAYLEGNSYRFDFKLNDSEAVNYYYLKMFFRGYVLDSATQIPIYVEEQRIEIPEGAVPNSQRYIDNGYIFTDESFNGNEIQFSGIAKSGLTLYPGQEGTTLTDSTQLFIRVESLSEDAYNFYSSHAIAFESVVDAFSESSLVFENVHNGLGIFAGISVSEVGVEVVF